MTASINLGQIKAIHIGTAAPVNTKMIWYDSNSGVNIHKYFDTISSSWRSFATLAKRGILTLLDGVNYSWDAEDNLIITHSLGVEDIYVSIKDNTKTTRTIIPYKTIDSNSVIVYTGERIEGEFCVLCF